MKPKKSNAQPVSIDMTPMIDVVFQLLIFFMLTLKVVESEGDFSINMPIGAPATPTETPNLDLKVRLRAAPDGRLAGIDFGNSQLGNDDRAFARLNNDILRAIGGRPNNPLMKDTEVEIEADYNLHYNYVVRAISACRGRLDPKTKRIVTYVEKIKFAPPKRPAGSA